MKQTCTYSGCGNALRGNNRTGFCWDHRSKALRGEPRLPRTLTGAKCASPACTRHLYGANVTGFCSKHSGSSKWELRYGATQQCGDVGCQAELRRDNQTGLCRKHAAPLFARKSALGRYGITEGQYQEMIQAQDGRCSVCTDPLDMAKKTHLDHNHQTGRLRGVLCHGCNVGIGNMKDSVTVLRAAADYLDRHARLAEGG